jgi:hypothetical protein
LLGFWPHWLPGNEAADAAAKATTLHGTLVSDRTPGNDVCTFLHRAILSSWQDEWDNAQGNIAYGEAICAGVAVFLQRRQEGGNLTHTPSDRSHAPDIWLFAAW